MNSCSFHAFLRPFLCWEHHPTPPNLQGDVVAPVFEIFSLIHILSPPEVARSHGKIHVSVGRWFWTTNPVVQNMPKNVKLEKKCPKIFGMKAKKWFETTTQIQVWTTYIEVIPPPRGHRKKNGRMSAIPLPTYRFTTCQVPKNKWDVEYRCNVWDFWDVGLVKTFINVQVVIHKCPLQKR